MEDQTLSATDGIVSSPKLVFTAVTPVQRVQPPGREKRRFTCASRSAPHLRWQPEPAGTWAVSWDFHLGSTGTYLRPLGPTTGGGSWPRGWALPGLSATAGSPGGSRAETGLSRDCTQLPAGELIEGDLHQCGVRCHLWRQVQREAIQGRQSRFVLSSHTWALNVFLLSWA